MSTSNFCHSTGGGICSRGPQLYPLTVYFDGECPICRREIDLMKLLNRKNRLQFTDFSTSSYSSIEHGLNQCDLERVMHARWANGTTISGVKVFRGMWAAIGLDFLTRLSRFSLIIKLLVEAYAWFGKNRLRLTNRA